MSDVLKQKARREDEETKLRDVLQARWARWDGLADRLEAAAGGAFKPSEDGKVSLYSLFVPGYYIDGLDRRHAPRQH